MDPKTRKLQKLMATKVVKPELGSIFRETQFSKPEKSGAAQNLVVALIREMGGFISHYDKATYRKVPDIVGLVDMIKFKDGQYELVFKACLSAALNDCYDTLTNDKGPYDILTLYTWCDEKGKRALFQAMAKKILAASSNATDMFFNEQYYMEQIQKEDSYVSAVYSLARSHLGL